MLNNYCFAVLVLLRWIAAFILIGAFLRFLQKNSCCRDGNINTDHPYSSFGAHCEIMSHAHILHFPDANDYANNSPDS